MWNYNSRLCHIRFFGLVKVALTKQAVSTASILDKGNYGKRNRIRNDVKDKWIFLCNLMLP